MSRRPDGLAIRGARRWRSWRIALALAGPVLLLALWRRCGWAPATGLRWYRLAYRAFYLLGLRVWERRTPPSDLIELVDGPAALPPGRALDLGCGTGTDSPYLARHGWDVTGVDLVPEALAIARRKAAAAGVSVRFVQGDVTHLPELVPDGYTLLLDFGCYHTLPPDQRAAYVAGVSAGAAPGATLLLYGFARPPRLAPMHAGVSLDEVRQRFEARWEIVTAERTSADAIRVARSRLDRSFELWRFRLRRRPRDLTLAR
jgi:SAM-dependent methyltransferase